MIRFEDISWHARDFRLERVSLEIPSGCYGVLMGRTGCGKTTLAELLCGLRTPDSGRIFLQNRDVTATVPGERGVGYVPQDGALFPTMTVAENLGFALRLRRHSRADIESSVLPLAARLGITHLLGRHPQHLSGGERQRVALGRALAARPAALVLDEPLSALDDEMREELAQLLKDLQSSLGLTALHITHHRQEALRLADRLFLMENGSVSETALQP